MKDEISKKLNNAVEIYSDNTILRAIVNAIPYIGSSLDVLISSRGQKIVQKRLNIFMEYLKTEMDTLQENKIDTTFLGSDEWFDLVVKSLEAATRTRDLGKTKLYSRVLRNSVILSKEKTPNPEDYLNVLIELTPREIDLAKAIYAQQNDHPQGNENELQWAKRKGWENLTAAWDVEEKDLDFLLKRLERTGLIREITGMFIGYMGGVYVVTETFRKLMKYLEEEE